MFYSREIGERSAAAAVLTPRSADNGRLAIKGSGPTACPPRLSCGRVFRSVAGALVMVLSVRY
jgi:hypothetical protein